LLLLDELPQMIQHIARHHSAELKRFLRWFRSARLAPGTKSRFVIGGSINLISTLDALGYVDTVNDLKIEQLGSFESQTAKSFIDAIFTFHQVRLSARTRNVILELVGSPIPYLLAVFLTAVLDRHRTTGLPVTPKLVESVFAEDLFSGASPFFLHYYARLQDYYPGAEGRAAKGILGLLSRSDTAVKRDTLYEVFLKTRGLQHGPDHREEFVRLMQRLENDFYVLARDDTYEFHSRVIQLWWKNHYGFQGRK
jgi:hypothetical protein